jgi:hypothetical protein
MGSLANMPSSNAVLFALLAEATFCYAQRSGPPWRIWNSEFGAGGIVWVLVRLLTVIKRKNPPIPVVHEL